MQGKPRTTIRTLLPSGKTAGLPDGITWPMIEAGMKEWDSAMKQNERQWPALLGRVFNAMEKARG